MSENNKKQKNPYFRNTERAPYELGHLLSSYSCESAAQKMTQKQIQIADAISNHATNSLYTLLSGIESIGNILWLASTNKESDIDKNDLSNLAGLISHLAVEAQFLDESKDEFSFIIQYQKEIFGHKSIHNHTEETTAV